MRVGIVTIQRDRGPWLAEWFAFHHLAGFSKFYFYAHLCKDNTHDLLLELGKFYDIQAIALTDSQELIQMKAYQHACQNFNHECDWFAFIDGDEFLFPVEANTVADVLTRYDYERISGLGVYWSCFGSSGHVQEPTGLIVENYRDRSESGFAGNRHVKSIVRGRQNTNIGVNAHVFNTPWGTVDETRRPIDFGLTPYDPTYQALRINHYACQSREFYEKFKRRFDVAVSSPDYIRSEQWWMEYDRNEVRDDSMDRWITPLRAEIRRIGFEGRTGGFASYA